MTAGLNEIKQAGSFDPASTKWLCQLERETGRELDNARGRGRGDTAEGNGIGNVYARIVKFGVVQQIEELGSQFDGCALRNGNVFRHRQVYVGTPRPTQDIASRAIAIAAGQTSVSKRCCKEVVVALLSRRC